MLFRSRTHQQTLPGCVNCTDTRVHTVGLLRMCGYVHASKYIQQCSSRGTTHTDTKRCNYNAHLGKPCCSLGPVGLGINVDGQLDDRIPAADLGVTHKSDLTSLFPSFFPFCRSGFCARDALANKANHATARRYHHHRQSALPSARFFFSSPWRLVLEKKGGRVRTCMTATMGLPLHRAQIRADTRRNSCRGGQD